MTPVRLGLLGKCTLHVGKEDRSDKLRRTGKGTELLALLCLNKGAAYESLYLQELLWPESEEQASRGGNYRQQLYRVREALGEGKKALLTERPGIRLNTGLVQCDLITFLECISGGDWQGAVKAYGGQFLPGHGGAWVEQEREILRRQYLHALAMCVEEQNPQDALATLTIWHKEAPESEEPLRQRWRCLVLLNRQAEALKEALDFFSQNPDAEPETKSWLDRLQRTRQLKDLPPLPVPWTHFIGRASELEQLVGRVRGGRLFTLCGEGGIGKTRLALELAQRLYSSFERQVAFIDLSRLPQDAGASSIWALLEQALGEPAQSIPGLRALLVIDNAEHVLESVGEVVRQLLDSGQELQFLLTSRKELGYRHERKLRLKGLRPEDARALFLQTSPVLEELDNKEEAAALDRLCQRMEGWPLVIELTASRREAFDSLRTLERNLEQALLEAGAASDPTISDRERDLNATLDWSSRLLDAQTRDIWHACPSFLGGISPEALAGVTGLPVKVIQAALEQLVAASLLRKEEERYRVLEPVRAYLKPKEIVQKAFAMYFLELAESQPGDAVLLLESANIAIAGEWLLENIPEHTVPLGAKLWRFWHVHGNQVHGLSFLKRALAAVPQHPLRIELLLGATILAYQSRLPEGEDFGRESQQEAKALGDIMLEARAWLGWGLATYSQENFDSAVSYFKKAEVLFAEADSERGVRLARANQVMVAARIGEPESVMAMRKALLEEFNASGDEEGWLTEANNQVYFYHLQGLMKDAPPMLIEILERGFRGGYRRGLIHGLQHSLSVLKSPEEVGVLMGGLERLRVEWGLPLVSEAVGSTQLIRWEREGQLGVDAWNECLKYGGAMSLTELVEYVIAALKKI